MKCWIIFIFFVCCNSFALSGEIELESAYMKKERLTDDLSGVFGTGTALRIPIIDNEFYDNWGTGISIIEAAKK